MSTKKITLNELRKLIKSIISENRKNLISENYFNDSDTAYIGRTDAYYSDEDNESVYSPDYWTYSNDINDNDFAEDGDLYQLTDEGKDVINSWLKSKNSNEYRRQQMRGINQYMNESPEEIWKYLTTNREFSKQIRKGYDIGS